MTRARVRTHVLWISANHHATMLGPFASLESVQRVAVRKCDSYRSPFCQKGTSRKLQWPTLTIVWFETSSSGRQMFTAICFSLSRGGDRDGKDMCAPFSGSIVCLPRFRVKVHWLSASVCSFRVFKIGNIATVLS